MAEATPLTWNNTVQGICEFIEVAVHTILYIRQVYPAEIFVRRRKYDTPVYQSRHPGLNEYIAGAVKAMREEMVLGSVDKVVVVIKDCEDVALERFIFSVRNMISIEPYNKTTGVEGAMSAQALGQHFRSFLIKLNMIESQLGHMESNGDLTFAIVLELQDNKAPSIGAGKADPPPWIPAPRPHTTAGSSNDAELFIVRAVDTGIINLSLVVQESEEKLRRMTVLNE